MQTALEGDQAERKKKKKKKKIREGQPVVKKKNVKMMNVNMTGRFSHGTPQNHAI